MNQKPTYDELEQRVHELELAESEHKKTIASLQENEKSYRHLFEHMLHEVHIWEQYRSARILQARSEVKKQEFNGWGGSDRVVS